MMRSTTDLNDGLFQALLANQRMLLQAVKDETASNQRTQNFSLSANMNTVGLQQLPYTAPQVVSPNIMLPTMDHSRADQVLERDNDLAYSLPADLVGPSISMSIFDERHNHQHSDFPPTKKRRVTLDPTDKESLGVLCEQVQIEDEGDHDELDDAAAIVAYVTDDDYTDDLEDLMRDDSPKFEEEETAEELQAAFPPATPIVLPEQLEALKKLMLESKKSQRQIQDWERREIGLKRSHSQTMRNSLRSRAALLRHVAAATAA